ncbi:hypothetical protein H0H81_008108, partial [Sphagnurus paluster]
NYMVKARFEDFIIGFNEAAERFLMMDVGDAKEAADAKIKAAQITEQPETGCHDNGYVATLRSHITAGFKQKLILLQSYSEMATGIADLELPVLNIPDLFLTQKLVTPVSIALIGKITRSPQTVLPQCSEPSPTPPALPEIDGGRDATPELLVGVGSTPPRRPCIPNSYSSAVQFVQRQPSTPDLDSSGSTTSEGSDDIPAPKGTRHVNPNIPEHYAEIRTNAKKAPYPAINKGGLGQVSKSAKCHQDIHSSAALDDNLSFKAKKKTNDVLAVAQESTGATQYV